MKERGAMLKVRRYCGNMNFLLKAANLCIAQANIPFIICVLAMMMLMAIEILGVWIYGELKGHVRKR